MTNLVGVELCRRLRVRPHTELRGDYHVIKGAADVIAHLPSGAFYKLNGIRDTNARADIAILQFDASDTPAVKGLGDSDELKIGLLMLPAASVPSKLTGAPMAYTSSPEGHGGGADRRPSILLPRRGL
jgi:hypothetical protein